MYTGVGQYERAMRVAAAAGALRERTGAHLSPAEKTVLDKRLNLARLELEARVAEIRQTGQKLELTVIVEKLEASNF